MAPDRPHPQSSAHPFLRILAALTLSVGCAWNAPARADEALALSKVMTGSFSTAKQAAGDPTFENVVMRLTPVWPKREDGPWLYLEQARVDRQDAPYRQRLYQLRYSPADGGVLVRVYTLPDAARFAGAWRNPDLLREIRREELIPVEGCEILLQRRREWEFNGSTRGDACPNTHQGARYMSSIMAVRPEGMRIWDRGFDADGRQVWGPSQGGYVFDKVSPEDPRVAAPTRSTSPG